MRRILTGLLAAVLAVGFLAAGPAEAKVYKMKPEERTAALKEKKARKARKKAGKSNAEAPGGWVEVKPGAKPERKARKSAQVGDTKAGARKGKTTKKSAEAEVKPAKKASKATVAAGDKKLGKNSRQKAAAKGDRLVSKSYAGEAKVRGTSTEVRRSGAAPGATAGPAAGDDLNAYSVNRPGQEKPAAPAVAPEVRHEVQPGPADTAKPLGTEFKGGEGRF